MGNGLFASPWEPDPWLGDDDGRVAPEFLWSALECPGAPVFWEPGTAPLAARTTASLTGRPMPGDRCVVVATSLGTTDRGHRTATWLLGADAAILGRAEVEWIVVPLTPP